MSITPFEKAGLAAEREVDRLGNHSGVLGDGGNGGPGIPVGDEEPPCRFENATPSLLGLIGVRRRVVGLTPRCLRLDFVSHFDTVSCNSLKSV